MNATVLTKAAMEATIRAYFDACNSGDAGRVAAYFTQDGVHYFPEGSPFGVLAGARAIGECWARCVRDLGSRWTVDNFCGDPETGKAVIEWTHFKHRIGQVLRGDEWYVFAPDGLIREIRAYYATPLTPGVAVHQIGGFPYDSRGYPKAEA